MPPRQLESVVGGEASHPRIQAAVHVDVFEGGRKVAEGAFGPDGVGRGKYTFARRDAVRKVV